jgi:PAS domain S-box-containing protein
MACDRRSQQGPGAKRGLGRAGATDVHPALDLAVFRQMADMSNDAFYLCDARGRFLYVNDRSTSSIGYTRDELLTMSVSDISPEFPPDRMADLVRELRHGPIAPFETHNRHKDGSLVAIEVSVAHLEIDGADYMFGVVRDIRERKQLEATRKSFTQRMLRTLEAERQRVARELHDDVGQAVATVGVLLHALAQTPGSVAEEVRPALAQTHASIQQITESVARIVRDYHPAELLGLGLEDTLRSHVVQFTQRHRLALELATTATNGLLDYEQELHLYRIAQEALANVARHAQARRVVVRLKQQSGNLVLTVRDDGIGFTPDDSRAGGGFGLVTMRERAELMQARLVINSEPRRGTEVRIAVGIDPQHSLALPPPVANPPAVADASAPAAKRARRRLAVLERRPQ